MGKKKPPPDGSRDSSEAKGIQARVKPLALRLLERLKAEIKDPRFLASLPPREATTLAVLDLDGCTCFLGCLPVHLRELLSQREQEVSRLVGMGHSNKEIAKVMEITEATVSAHLERIYGKLGIRSRVKLAVLALGLGAGDGQVIAL